MKIKNKAIEILNFCKDNIKNNEKYNNFNIFYKVKNDSENESCTYDYIVFELDTNGYVNTNCRDRYEVDYTLRFQFVSNFNGAFNNLEIVNFLFNIINNKYNIKNFNIVDSIVSEPCSPLLTNLTINLKTEILK